MRYYWTIFTLLAAIFAKECPKLVTQFSQVNCTGKSGLQSYFYDFDEDLCVPICKNYQDYVNKECSEKCMPGYLCDKRCGPDDELKQFSCKEDKDCLVKNGTICRFYCVAENTESCMAYHINTSDYSATYWSAEKFKPECNNDGTWKAKQCKGGIGGRCMCYDSTGNRIFGQALYSESTNMTCACSRRKADLQGTRDTTFHCDSMGNFEPLQCDLISGQCYCVEPQTGELDSLVVPQSGLQLLHCYSNITYGSQYLRQCESKKFAQSLITKKLENHGVTYTAEDFLMCDDDGSYGALTIESDNVYCTWRDNTKIASWFTYLQNGYSDMNCYCARDLLQFKHGQACLTNGNYKPLQHDNDDWYCVDKDGFSKTGILTNITSKLETYCDQYY